MPRDWREPSQRLAGWSTYSLGRVVHIGHSRAETAAKPWALIIAPDGDEPGRKAVASLAQTATGRGWNVSLMVPPDKQDWNDLLQSEVTA